MCGRISLAHIDWKTLRTYLALTGLPEEIPPPRYNVAPSQDIPVVPNKAARAVEFFRWGLVPHWAQDEAIGNKLINARSETLAEKPSFKQALKKRRCVVIADGFYEWAKIGKKKVPLHITKKSGEPLLLAGLWETWSHKDKPEAPPLHSCTIVTCAPNEMMKPIHNRMPVIIGHSNIDRWLSPDPLEPADALPLLGPYPSTELTARALSDRVNSPTHDDPEVLSPIEQQSLFRDNDLEKLMNKIRKASGE